MGQTTFDVPAGKVNGDVGVLNTKVGDLSSLTTTAKTNLVSAVNEIDSDVSALNGKITNLIKTKDFDFSNLNFTSGIIGTRGQQVYQALDLPAGATVIGLYIFYITDSSLMNPVAFFHGPNLYLNVYRAVSSAMSSNEVKVRVCYI